MKDFPASHMFHDDGKYHAVATRVATQVPDLVAAIFVPAESATNPSHRGQVQLLLLGAGRQIQIRQLDHTSTFAESKFHLDIPIKTIKNLKIIQWSRFSHQMCRWSFLGPFN